MKMERYMDNDVIGAMFLVAQGLEAGHLHDRSLEKSPMVRCTGGLDSVNHFTKPNMFRKHVIKISKADIQGGAAILRAKGVKPFKDIGYIGIVDHFLMCDIELDTMSELVEKGQLDRMGKPNKWYRKPKWLDKPKGIENMHNFFGMVGGVCLFSTKDIESGSITSTGTGNPKVFPAFLIGEDAVVETDVDSKLAINANNFVTIFSTSEYYEESYGGWREEK